VVAYINVTKQKFKKKKLEFNSGEYFHAQSTSSLSRMIIEETKKIPFNINGTKTLYEYWKKQTIDEPKVTALSSGTDFHSFIYYLGIPSINFGFDGDLYVYHSLYDNNNYIKFIDPDYVHAEATSKLMGSIVLRLSNEEILSFNQSENYKTIQESFDHIKQDEEIISFIRGLTEEQGKEVARVYGLIQNSLDVLKKRANLFNEHVNKVMTGKVKNNNDFVVRKLNDINMQFERLLLDKNGLYNRNWYKNILLGPSRIRGASEMFPGLYDTCRDNNFDQYINSLFQLLNSIYFSSNSLLF
jgi:N-acetylated-alpha-linked acidic dipeptidase